MCLYCYSYCHTAIYTNTKITVSDAECDMWTTISLLSVAEVAESVKALPLGHWVRSLARSAQVLDRKSQSLSVCGLSVGRGLPKING